MPNQLHINAQVARELTWCDPTENLHGNPDDPDDLNGIVAVVENRHTGQETRWTSIHEIVLRDRAGFLWRRLYHRGLTENQSDEETFPGEGRRYIPFDAVQRKTVEAIVYVPLGQ